MFFFKGKEDMGLDASLSLLDLSANDSIDDANQAYTYLHRMIDLFHRDNETDNGDRQEDLELLACAYEKAVSYLSNQDSRLRREEPSATSDPIAGDDRPAADLHFTINFSSTGDDHSPAHDGRTLPEPDGQIIENAIAIISRRLQEAESGLEAARQAVEAATAAVEAANQRLEKSKQARMNAIIAAKSARSRAMLLEIEAQRATGEALAIAEKARDRVKTARQAAKQANAEADDARDRIRKVTRMEEAAAAEAVCAEARLEEAKQRLKALTHTVVEARSQLRMFDDYGAQTRPLAASIDRSHPAVIPGNPPVSSPTADACRETRRQIMSDLAELENSLSARKQEPMPSPSPPPRIKAVYDQGQERRRHERLYYPDALRPMFSFEGRSIPVLDLSQTGMGLDPDAVVGKSHLVRGAIVFSGLPTMNVTGRVVRQDGDGLGLRLVTRIGNHILDQERKRLGA